MSVVMQFLAFVITILVLVSIHEAGHFLVAKAMGIKVIRFSIGFGRPFFRFHDSKGTEYVLAYIPLGGYVKLLDEREVIVPESEKHLAFNRQSLWARTLVVIAGPLTNILFAILGFWLMLMNGIETYRPIIGSVQPGSIAAQAGLKKGDEIYQVDGKATPYLQRVVMAIIDRLGEKTSMTMAVKNTTSQQKTVHRLELENWRVNDLNPAPLTSLGIVPIRPFIPAVIYEVAPESPASRSGIKPQDQIIAINGQSIQDWYEFIGYTYSHPGQRVVMKIKRNETEFTVPVTIAKKWGGGFKAVGFIGVSPKPVSLTSEYLMLRKYPPLKALVVAVHETWQFLVFNFVVLKKMLLGQVSLSSLGGPITIFQTADMAFAQGLSTFLGFLALISVMLAFINLLPIPGLDGGHLLNYLIEAIIRRPLSIKFELVTVQIGMFLLILLMLWATFNDILRVLTTLRTP